jgi:hypothetical protein
MTGYAHRAAAFGAAQNQPSFGAVVSRHRGPTHPATLLPTCVKQDYIYAEGPSWLGPAYCPFDLHGNAMGDMTLRIPQELPPVHPALAVMDNQNRRIDQSA